ncbi:MAG: hypothetical protein ACI392_02800 [Paludibacteraceae bacterium]
MKKQSLPLLLLSCVLAACSLKPQADVAREPLLEVEGQFLYKDELAQIIPAGTAPEDSAVLADAFIRKWATNILLYETAKRNIANEDEIDAMVEEYRKTLTIHYYQQRLVAQRLPEPTDAEVEAFYEQHAGLFPLSENVLCGIFLKVPNGAPKIERVRKTIKDLNDEADLQTLEEYSVRHAAVYEYFPDKWVYFNELTCRMPPLNTDQTHFLENASFYEASDSTYTYFLKVTDYRLVGMATPLDFVQEKIRTILSNQRKLEYLQQFEVSLYDDAVTNGQITFYHPLQGKKSLKSYFE